MSAERGASDRSQQPAVSSYFRIKTTKLRMRAVGWLALLAPVAGLRPALAFKPARHAATARLHMCAAPGDNSAVHSTADADQPESDRSRRPSWDDVESRLGPTESALVGVPLFFLLQSVSVSTASTLLPDDLVPPAGRVVAFGLFAAIQAAAGLPLEQWALRPAAARAEWALLDSPLAAVAVFATFALLAFSPVAVAALSGQADIVDVLLPTAGALPPPARIFDVLLAAPLTEELFFRAWLLSAAQRAGAPPAAAIAGSALTFAVWHAGAGASAGGGGLLTFGVLGAWLAVAYTKGGRRLTTTVGAHALWNAAILAIRVVRG